MSGLTKAIIPPFITSVMTSRSFLFRPHTSHVSCLNFSKTKSKVADGHGSSVCACVCVQRVQSVLIESVNYLVDGSSTVSEGLYLLYYVAKVR